MKILICSDGMPAADDATRLGAALAAPLQAETTLLGIAEKSGDEPALRAALDKQAEWLRQKNVSPQIATARFRWPALCYDLGRAGLGWHAHEPPIAK